MRDLARRLLAAIQTASGPHGDAAVLVSDRLRVSLTRFAGAAGFASLLRRALLLASAEVPALQSVKLDADGRLQGFEQLVAGAGRPRWRRPSIIDPTWHCWTLACRDSTVLRSRSEYVSNRFCRRPCWSP